MVHLFKFVRSKGKARVDCSLDKFGFGMKKKDEPAAGPPGNPVETITSRQAKSTWARMIQKVHEVDPLVCPKCGERMRILAVIKDQQEIRQIMEHLNA